MLFVVCAVRYKITDEPLLVFFPAPEVLAITRSLQLFSSMCAIHLYRSKCDTHLKGHHFILVNSGHAKVLGDDLDYQQVQGCYAINTTANHQNYFHSLVSFE
jgi:hypothetical protein